MKTRLDINNLSSWTPYKKENCESCLALCCTQEVEVNTDDLIRMGELDENQLLK